MPIKNARTAADHWVNIALQAERFPLDGKGATTANPALSHIAGKRTVITVVTQTIATVNSDLELTNGQGALLPAGFPNNGNFLGVPRRLGNPGIVIPLSALGSNETWGAQIGATLGAGYTIFYRILSP